VLIAFTLDNLWLFARDDLETPGIGIPPKAFVPDANLDAALERLKQGVFGIAGAKRGGRG
jgi:hypothetical protein